MNLTPHHCDMPLDLRVNYDELMRYKIGKCNCRKIKSKFFKSIVLRVNRFLHSLCYHRVQTISSTNIVLPFIGCTALRCC